MDNQYIRKLRIQQKSVGKRLYAVVCLMLVTSLLLTSASFAWLTISRAPEVTGVTSSVGANGNLEIALGKNIGESAIGDSFDKNEVTKANRTWGNLIDLSDSSYGLQEIVLRPAILNSAGGAVNTLHPLAYPVYSKDGRVERIYANNMFAGTYNGGTFITGINEYGVHAIGATPYVAPGLEDTFGPLSQRQVTYYYAREQLWGMSQSSYEALCRKYQSVLMAYCYYGKGVTSSEFDLDAFTQQVDELVSAANEELRLGFTLLAAAERTSPENYHAAMDYLERTYPNYEAVRSLVSSASQTMGAEDVGEAVAELRAFQDAAAQLKAVIASGEIDSSDGYSMEEIAQTVGLIFDLERTNFSVSTVVYKEEPCSYTDNNFYSSVISGLYYQIPHHEKRGWLTLEERYGGSSVNNLTCSLPYSNEYQDNDSREAIANNIIDSHIYPLYNSLRLADLDQAIANLYAGHWSYWELCADEYKLLQEQMGALNAQITLLEEQLQGSENSELEAELQLKIAALESKEEQCQALIDEETYAFDDTRLETVRLVMTDTIEVMRQYTLWSIAYFACDGQVPDDAYHRMQEIAESSEYIHPRTAYRALCNYGVTPAEALTPMVEAYEKLEQELLFLQRESEDADEITWAELNAELQRVFGTATHTFSFRVVAKSGSNLYSRVYSPEDISAPVEVMTKIREEFEAYETAKDGIADYWYSEADHHVRYGSYEENQVWSQSLGLLCSLHSPQYAFDYGESEYTLEDLEFDTSHSMYFVDSYWFDISVGVGSEDNFNESGLTVRQTRFQTAQQNISYYQNQLITAAVNADKDMVTLLMQLIAGQSEVSLSTISDYLSSLQQQLDYAEKLMYHATLAMAASDYAKDSVYQNVYSGSGSQSAARMIELLRQSDFDEKVLTAFAHRMDLLDSQKGLLNRSKVLLNNYQDPDTGAFTTEQISAAEATELLDPVLDMDTLMLYGYVAEKQDQNGDSGTTDTHKYVRTVLYTGSGSPSVQIDGNQATVGNNNPVTLLGDVYLSLGRSLSGSLLALAKAQVETYAPPVGSVNAGDIADLESGMNRKAYSVVTGGELFTLNLCTEDASYALATNLWDYTGNTEYISANNVLVDLYGYCIDLAFRTNAANSNLLLQTEAINRIDNDSETLAYTSMGAGSYMEFAIDHPSYSLNQAKEYMSCLRVVITDTRTGYIYGYAALDMDKAEVVGTSIKAPLRLYNKNTGIMLEGDAAQYICRLDQNLEKNLTVYVYLDGAKASNNLVSAYDEQSLHGALNLQFSSSADLIPAGMDVSENSSNRPSEDPEIPEKPETPESGDDLVEYTGAMTDTITWTLYSNGLLKFTGTGAMPDFSAVSDAPWYAHREDISTVEISDGITYLGLGNLAALDYAEIIIPESVVAIVGANGWGGQKKTVQYAGSEQQWNAIAIFSSNSALIGGTINAATSNAQLLYSGNIESTSISWTLSADGILTVKGSGAMPDWSETYEAPWDQYKTSIKHIVITEAITYVGSYAFDSLPNVQTAKIAATVTELGDYAFSECKKLLAVTVGDDSSMTEIGQYCFDDCSSLRYINIPDSVTTLGEAAFQACTVLDHVVMNGVTNLGDYVFYCCENLSSISLAEGMDVIPYGAFARNFKLTSVTIPSTVIRIEQYAFLSEHDDPFTVYYGGSNEQWDTILIDYNNTYFGNAQIHYGREIVNSGVVNDEITWSLDETGVLIIKGTGEIPNYADGVGIYDQDIAEWIHEDYHTVIISDGITSIGEYAFLWAEDLTTVIITTSVTNISWNAFDGCTSEITILGNGYEYEFEPLGNGSSYPSNITFEYLY